MSAVSARVLNAAIDWQLRLDDAPDNPPPADFHTWLAADPEHARVWRQLTALNSHLAPAAAPLMRRALLSRPTPRRLPRALLGLSLLGALTLGGLASQRPLTDYLADARTGAGEQRELRLSDNSQVTLNSASALDIDFDATQRLLTLRSGEILVQTAPGDERPFIVATAQGRLRALGTRFLVRREGERTRLTVLQSAVAAHPSNSGETRVIHAGQQVEMQATQLGSSQPAAPAADAWSRGMLVVEGQRLDQVLAQLSPYRTGYLGVDPRIAGLTISGSFPLHDSDLALDALALSLPVRIERVQPWWVRVVPAKP
ncbi:FecR family protein [Pseudomonas cuatrocienegasensis]|uniref:FecR family protein n=1 Tax=Pseudomonas cuatrocienegasensis TaxID=543360 RepID=A0ABY1BIS7_9PSED|nr:MULTISPECIES: FecR family protein [Pseudomonas]OEC34630.1 amino acid ABC transporter substrate-binding protein [Pseudomonas sp. 21C1]SEQ96111.1 FecR family protein [Pseudomonas cuatrocienegasensis]